MATGNVILGTATGSIGDVTLMRRAGKQVSRVRVRKIGNPKSANQAANRALLNTLGTAYGYLRGIVDHSFQGKAGRLANMREFFKLNQGVARATGSVSPSGTDEGFNFNFKGETVMRPNPLKIASGTLPEISMVNLLTSGTDLPNGFKLAALDGTETYAEVLSKLRLQQGDQITICGVADPEFVGPVTDPNTPRSYGDFLYARVILDPADGNLDGPFLSGGAISQPNARNEGTISFNASFAIGLTNLPAENFTAMCVIASRYQNGEWKRSNASFMVADGYESSNTMSEVYMSYMLSEEEPVSDLYLNQSISRKSVASSNRYVLVSVGDDRGDSVSPVDGFYQCDGYADVTIRGNLPSSVTLTPSGTLSSISAGDEDGTWIVKVNGVSSAEGCTVTIGNVVIKIKWL